MNDNVTPRSGLQRWFFQMPPQAGGQCLPVRCAMRLWWRWHRLVKQQAGSRPGVTESLSGTGEPQQQMIAWVRSSAHREIEFLLSQFLHDAAQFRPRPAVQLVFAAECRPRRGVGNQLHRGSKATEQGCGVRLGEQGDVGMPSGFAEEGHREREVAQPPQFKGQQAGSGIAGCFCQAGGVEF